jgi:hypothetical protein
LLPLSLLLRHLLLPYLPPLLLRLRRPLSLRHLLLLELRLRHPLQP